MVFNFSYYLFTSSIRTLADAERTLRNTTDYSRMPLRAIAGAAAPPCPMVAFVRPHLQTDPGWLSFVQREFDAASLNADLGQRGLTGYLQGQPQIAALSLVILVEHVGRVFAVTAGNGTGILDRSALEAAAGREAMLNNTKEGSVTDVAWKTGGRGGKAVSETHKQPAKADSFFRSYDPRVLNSFGGQATIGGADISTSGGRNLRLATLDDLADIAKNCVDLLAAYLNRAGRPAEFDWFAPVEPVRDPVEIATLDAQMIAELRATGPCDFSIWVPPVSSNVAVTYELRYQTAPRQNYSRGNLIVSWSESAIRSIVAQILTTPYLLRSAIVVRLENGTEREIAFTKFVSFMLRKPNGTLCMLEDGDWSYVTQKYLDELNKGVNWLCGKFSPSVVLPNRSLKLHANEGAYNQAIAQSLKYFWLDRAKARPPFDGSPLELCDFMSPTRELYCVKCGVTAQPVAYVADQAAAAARALKADPQYWQHYIQNQYVVCPDDPMASPHLFRFVVALISDDPRPLAQQLKYRAKRSLMECHTQLRQMDFDSGVVHILEVP